MCDKISISIVGYAHLKWKKILANMGVHLYVVMYICSMKFKWENKKKKLLPKVRALTQISDILFYVPVCCFTEIIEIQ